MNNIQSLAPVAQLQAQAAFCETLFSACAPFTWAEAHPDGRINVRLPDHSHRWLDDAARARVAALPDWMRPDQVEQAPALDIDAELFSTRHPMGSRHVQERAVIWNFLRHMERNGWEVSSVHDGEGATRCASLREVMELVFNLDDSRVRFRKAGGKVHVACFVLGNSPHEVIADHSAPDDDSEGFVALVNAYQSEYLFPDWS